MVRRKSLQPKHRSSLPQRRSCSSSSSNSASEENETESRTPASSSNRNTATTSETSTRSNNKSYKSAPDAGPKNKPKKRAGNMYFRIKHISQLHTIPKTTFREMRTLQKSTYNLIPRLPFQRVVREIMQDIIQEREVQRIQTSALKALQESAEMYLIQLLEDSYFCTLNAKRKTLQPRDIRCARRCRGIEDVINH